MNPSENCYNLIKEFEGCKLTAYPDPATGGEPITIGVGHTGGIKLGTTITQEQADAYLVSDVAHAATAVNQMVTVPMTQGQFDALCSFAFNLGVGNLKSSTLLKDFNANNVQGAANQFLVWNKAAGHVMAGLTRRREAERTLFLS
jgi:lysozyme